jgi:hypothetical protein
MTKNTALTIRNFRNLCVLHNGVFTFAADAAEYAAWTGLRATLVASGVRMFEDLYIPGVVALIDRVTLVAQQ